MFAVFISVFVTLVPCSIIVKHTAPCVVTFKNDILHFYQQNGKNKSPFGPESQCLSCAVTKLVHELFPLQVFPPLPICFYHFSSF